MENYLARFLALGSQHSQEEERLDFPQLVSQLLPLVRPAARHAGVRLEEELPGTPIYVMANADALSQLVLNLVVNAVEAASSTPETDQADHNAAWVRVRLAALNADRVELAVEDSGPGPTQAIREEMFEAFATAKSDGVGLGLAVAREVAERHRGSLRWERKQANEREGNCTRFLVNLPHAAEGQQDRAHATGR
jgi:two-component system C4-dicarboxylate transport sensor histidine kinase DctB